MVNLEKTTKKLEDMKCPHCKKSLAFNSYDRSNLDTIFEELDEDNTVECPCCEKKFRILLNTTFTTEKE